MRGDESARGGTITPVATAAVAGARVLARPWRESRELRAAARFPLLVAYRLRLDDPDRGRRLREAYEEFRGLGDEDGMWQCRRLLAARPAALLRDVGPPAPRGVSAPGEVHRWFLVEDVAGSLLGTVHVMSDVDSGALLRLSAGGPLVTVDGVELSSQPTVRLPVPAGGPVADVLLRVLWHVPRSG